MYDPDMAINEQYEEIEQLKDTLQDETLLRGKLAGLLERTANALKGQPKPLHLHDWSDLPKVATQLKDEIKALEEFKDVALKQYPGLFGVWLDHLRRKDNERRME